MHYICVNTAACFDRTVIVARAAAAGTELISALL